MRGRKLVTATAWISGLYVCLFVGRAWRDETTACGSVGCNSDIVRLHPVTSDVGGVTKVLFLGYRRGGSSISSEIFDTDPRAIFWYEPLDAFYFSTTGYHGRKDQRVLMYDNETDFRPAELWEHTEMVHFFQALYRCELSLLPSELLAHRFMKHTSAVADYFSCYQHATDDSITQDLDSCRDGLETVCGRSVETSLANRCREIMNAAHAASVRHVTTGSQRASHVSAVIQEHLRDSAMIDVEITALQKNIVSYATCMNKIEVIIQKCLHIAEKACQEKRLRTAKIVRATMSIVKSIIHEIPDLKIIIFVRDPRAMAYSRSGRDKQPLNIINSCVRACKKLSLDMQAKKDIDSSHPGAVQILRYEDFVDNPEYWAEVMYNHVGHTSPPDLDVFIQSHMFAAEDDGKKWGNIRTNASEIATRWRALISPEILEQMQDICGDLIQDLGYPLY